MSEKRNNQESLFSPGSSYWGDVWLQFKKHKGALLGAIIFSGIVISVILGPFLWPFEPNAIDIRSRNQGPSLLHPFGTDQLGRDTFSRMIAGGQTSITVGLAAMFLSLILGTFIEIVPVFYLTIPIFTAIILSFDQSLIHLYVVFVAFAGIGMITPPVCVGIYTSASVIKENPGNAFKEVPLFTVVGILYGILMILFPGLSTWLPNYLSG